MASRPESTEDATSAEEIAVAFRLGAPLSGLVPVRKGSFESWRLPTRSGTYLVKRLWQRPDPERRAELEVAMAFERRVAAAGIPVAPAVVPATPLFGRAASVGTHGTFRVYEWVDHRPVGDEDDLVAWLGQMLATLHALHPLGQGFEPEWRWLGVRPREDWERWLATDRPWVALARERLPFLLELTDRIVRHHRGAPDHVISHRDLGP